jgi:sarcosine oxidase subunit beta
MRGYSAFSLLRHALGGHAGWSRAIPDTAPRPAYDIVIIGGGGHGLATAYYLARQAPKLRIALVERGWIGGGNSGRNTTIVRSNYLFAESAALYDFALRLYEGLGRELNYNIMLSQRGVITLAHSHHDMDTIARWATSIQMQGIDSEVLTAQQVHAEVPILNTAPTTRYPVFGGFVQRRGGTARHDAVVWGYARAAAALGVDIIQNCEVIAFDIAAGQVRGIETSRGTIRAERVAMAVAGHSSVLAGLAGIRMPVTSYCLQAFVSEPVKPLLDTVIMSPGTGVYISQSDKGEMVIGGQLDLYPSYGQRGSPHILESIAAAAVEQYPVLSRMRMLRQWGGIVDVVHDSSPIIDRTSVGGLYINCGWGTGGFKAIPAGGWCLADLVAHDRPGDLIRPFGFARFTSGALVDEAGAAGIAH